METAPSSGGSAALRIEFETADRLGGPQPPSWSKHQAFIIGFWDAGDEQLVQASMCFSAVVGDGGKLRKCSSLRGRLVSAVARRLYSQMWLSGLNGMLGDAPGPFACVESPSVRLQPAIWLQRWSRSIEKSEVTVVRQCQGEQEAQAQGQEGCRQKRGRWRDQQPGPAAQYRARPGSRQGQGQRQR